MRKNLIIGFLALTAAVFGFIALTNPLPKCKTIDVYSSGYVTCDDRIIQGLYQQGFVKDEYIWNGKQ